MKWLEMLSSGAESPEGRETVDCAPVSPSDDWKTVNPQ